VKITLTAETGPERAALGKDSVEIAEVQQYALLGVRIRDLVVPEDFHMWNGALPYLIGRLYYVMKRLEYEDTHPKKSMIVGVGGSDAGS
jgi:hypothetical protein